MIEEVKRPTPEEQDARMAEVINLVLHRNGLKLGKDDPLLIIHTLQEFLVQRLATQQNELIGNFYEGMNEHIRNVQKDWCDNAKKEANKMLLKASNASTQLFELRLKEATDEAKEAVVSSIQKASKEAIAQLEAKTESNNALYQKSLYFLTGATAINVLTAILLIIMFL
ncbi:MAG: hypothetical protein J6P19_05520 [Acetobacter sp.]|nr:hypothetical protein [Acetobacter sp.]